MTPIEKAIQRELEYLDLDLFLDYDRHPVYGFLYYSVKRRMPDGVAPLEPVSWCVGSTPLPLSLDIVAKVRSQEGDIRDAIAQATAHNAALKELRRQEQLQAYKDIAEEWQKGAKRTYTSLPKSIED